MLKCRDIVHQADTFLDGDVGQMHRLFMWMHFSVRTGCARLFDQLRVAGALTQGALAWKPPSPADKEMIDVLFAAFHGQQTKGGKSPAQEGCGNV